ncbi:cobalt-precorrin 5A hydrolase [Serpentinicella alkaliphila]|uniref:Cobalt-precorrin 5A acetaldehyde-lyase n=1 Tax=Serpentinicella alkaliphila TaxID=1734049 RepID=A0A4R2TQT5_9FIRM|nr:cobalt-precorrin 5A hydrolase [Serpentinicella alkaliphila]QUH27106.1 cobalt-precorrin 5A hydrolase [Serpentinicella alkaliphila]TCQ05236.1 cobalt-precorrin 5A acetaldehyde-lyase [Serpentinicella alkaliphila]
MKRAILSITEDGLRLGLKIQEASSGHLYTLEKYINSGTPNIYPIKGNLKDFMAYVFVEYKEIVMIMSSGIAVRSIAPWLNSKLTDPAVVVCDDSGKYAISLVSGHIGGANKVAEEIGEIIGGQAIITTASDNRNIESVDMLAKRLSLHIDNYENAKLVTACMVNGKSVGYIDEYGILNNGKKSDCSNSAIIYIGNKAKPTIEVKNKTIVKLTKKCLVIGVGCRKGTEPEKLIAAVESIFNENNLSPVAIKGIATIDLKGKEPAIIQLSNYYNVNLNIISREDIKKVEDRFENSTFVKETIGVGSVCEPAAYISSNYGKRIVPKVKAGGITVSVYEVKNVEVIDE